MGLAPLLGFLLDALLGGTRLDEQLEGWVQRSMPRIEFIVRNAFGGPTIQAGYGMAIWLAGAAIVTAWLMGVVGYVLFQEYGLFLARAVIFLLLFTARRLTARGIEVLLLISSGDFTGARHSLRRMGPSVHRDDTDSLSGAAVLRLSGATLGATLVPLFWGLIGGSTLAAGALVLHIGALQRPDDVDDAQPMWQALERINGWVTTPAAWVGGLVFPLAVTLVGGRRTAALGAFLGDGRESPSDRLGRAVSRGLQLRTREDDGALIAGANEVQKVVQMLFIGGFLCAVTVSTLSVFLHHLL